MELNKDELRKNPWKALKSIFENDQERTFFCYKIGEGQIKYLDKKLKHYTNMVRDAYNEYIKTENRKKQYEIKRDINLDLNIQLLESVFPNYKTVLANKDKMIELQLKTITNI